MLYSQNVLSLDGEKIAINVLYIMCFIVFIYTSLHLNIPYVHNYVMSVMPL